MAAVDVSNPLLEDFVFPPFDRIKPDHVGPGILTLVENLGRELDELEKSVGPTWSESVEPFEKILDKLTVVWGCVDHLKSVQGSAELRSAVAHVEPEKVKFELRLRQSKPIYKAFEAIRDSPGRDQSDVSKRIIENLLNEGILYGVALEDDKQAEFNKIEPELQKLSRKFDENVLDATEKFVKLVTDRKEIEGVPPNALEFAAQTAVSKGYENATADNGPWVFTLGTKSYSSVMKYAQNRSLREELNVAYLTRASSGELDNTKIINQILELRLRKAELLGFDNYAEVSMIMKMATLEKAKELLKKLCDASRSGALQDWEDIKSYAKREGAAEADNMMPWDIPLWNGRLQKSESPSLTFSLPNVMDGLFSLANKLFDIKVEPDDGQAPVWNKDVRFYHVKDSSEAIIAYFYFDPYSRSSKRGGAWTEEVISRSRVLARDGSSVRLPVVHIVANLMPPKGEKPCLMTFDDVKTVFHEFGHALQQMLTHQNESLVAGNRGIEWDAIEFPSEFMENWCYDRNTIMSFAKDYKSGDALAKEMCEKLVASRTYRASSKILLELRLAILDLELHTLDRPDEESIYGVDQTIRKETQVVPSLPYDRSLCTFSHIFSGGYVVGYYGYTWGRMLAADAFSAFEDAGLDNDEDVIHLGRRFRDTVLALGGAKAALDVFKDFRGRDPSLDPLLRYNGLPQVAASSRARNCRVNRSVGSSTRRSKRRRN